MIFSFKSQFLFCLNIFFFFSAIPDRLFKMMKESEGSKSFKSLVEVNISFVPYESQVWDFFCFNFLLISSISGGGGLY